MKFSILVCCLVFFLTHQGTINSRQKNNQIPLISTAASSTVLWGDLFFKKALCCGESTQRKLAQLSCPTAATSQSGAETLRGHHSRGGAQHGFLCESPLPSTLPHCKQLLSFVFTFFPCPYLFICHSASPSPFPPCLWSMSHSRASGDLLFHSAKSPHPAEQFSQQTRLSSLNRKDVRLN